LAGLKKATRVPIPANGIIEPRFSEEQDVFEEVGTKFCKSQPKVKFLPASTIFLIDMKFFMSNSF
jgi:hypothetical protein